MEEVEARTPKNVVLTGIAVQLPQSTRAIHRAFLLSTLYAVILIFVLVLLDLRRLGQTLLAISVLVFGLPMLIVAMAVWRWAEDPMGIPGTWNFANFFALPILIGAGHEYGVFLVHRYREVLHDPRRVWKWWDASDRALLLCAIVTSCSFGFLMGAQHRGLASLGWVMAVGSACIYLAGLLVLRPILQWLLRRNSKFE
ncbi:MAG: MMPL family transporter [Phycisphaerales bacterium]|nr:MMPL family transporter [Phycisphaerales bacterium]